MFLEKRRTSQWHFLCQSYERATNSILLRAETSSPPVILSINWEHLWIHCARVIILSEHKAQLPGQSKSSWHCWTYCFIIYCFFFIIDRSFHCFPIRNNDFKVVPWLLSAETDDTHSWTGCSNRSQFICDCVCPCIQYESIYTCDIHQLTDRWEAFKTLPQNSWNMSTWVWCDAYVEVDVWAG